MRSSIKCMIQANVKWLQTLRINWAAWQRKRKLAGVPVSASIPCWQPLSRRAVWTVVFAVLLLAMVVFVVPVCLLTQLSRGNFRSWPSVTFYLINLRLCLPLYRPTKNLSLNIRLHVHDDCLYGFFSGKARPWLICFNWLAQTWLVCFQSTSTQHKRYSIVWALTHTHTRIHARSPADYVIRRTLSAADQQQPEDSQRLFCLFPQTPWTLRLPSSRRYLFTMAWICTSLSQLPSLRGSDLQICMKILPELGVVPIPMP